MMMMMIIITMIITITSCGEMLCLVHIRRGIFQGDSLSPLIFAVCTGGFRGGAEGAAAPPFSSTNTMILL